MLRKKSKDITFSIVFFATMVVFWLALLSAIPAVNAKTPKAKFYDFEQQLINGEVKKPITLYTDARQRVKFGRLLKLKKSFIPQLLDTAKERTFR
jgi:hypothetical protein